MMQVDLPRNAARYEVPLDFHADAPFNSLALMRGAVVAEQDGRLLDYTDAMFRAMWAEARDLADPGEVGAALTAAGFDAAAYAARIQEPAVKQELIARTEAAADRGVFGSPTFFVGEEMFFGQDRFEQVLAAAD